MLHHLGAMANTICHVEIETTDLARAQGFYGAMFDWNFRQFTDDMVVFGSGDQHLGGLMLVDEVGAGRSPSIWVEVEDVQASLDMATTIGGGVVSEKSPVPHVGWSGQISDLDGNTIGLVEFEKKG